jgi:hypothetical protein
MKAAIPGGIVLLLLANNPQAYRLELIFVPVAAVGLALLAQRGLALQRERATARAATLA